MVNRTRINSAQSIFLWNITCHRAISSIAEFHHVLGCCFMIQRVILISFFNVEFREYEKFIPWVISTGYGGKYVILKKYASEMGNRFWFNV